MRAIVTAGPASTPIDRVRRITNFSTGEIGIELSRALAGLGFTVDLFLGRGATVQWSTSNPFRIETFDTNDDLLLLLANSGEADAVFQAAALADFAVGSVKAADGSTAAEGKISSRAGEIQLVLRPVPKILTKLRAIFAEAVLVGWKYEVDGTPSDVVAAGSRQIVECRLDGSVLNGPAFGDGFGFLTRDASIERFDNKSSLSRGLADWTLARLRERESPKAS